MSAGEEVRARVIFPGGYTIKIFESINTFHVLKKKLLHVQVNFKLTQDPEPRELVLSRQFRTSG